MDTKIKFCPECGSASVEYSTLSGGAASCKKCEWKGVKEELLVSVLSHDFSDPNQLITLFARDLRNMMGKVLANPLVELLAKWGFFTDPKNLQLTMKESTLYIQTAARAMAVSLMQTREFVATGGVQHFKKEKKHVS